MPAAHLPRAVEARTPEPSEARPGSSQGDGDGAERITFPWRVRAFWGAFVAYWLFFLVLYTASRVLQGTGAGPVISLGEQVAVAASDGFFSALMCLLAFAIAWHVPIQRGRLRTAGNLGLALVGACAVSAVVQCVQSSIAHMMLGWPMPNYLLLLIVAMPGNIQIFTCFVGAGYSIRFFSQANASAAAAARLASESEHLERELTQADLQLARSQLQVLKMQLDPHFLFNTFNAVTTLMHRDPVAADGMLTRLSELLRITLTRSGTDEVTLREEVEFLRLYLEIQESRFGDRLVVEWRVEPSVEGARVPHMILQPIVENAIQHGISQVPGPGLVRVAARGEHGKLLLEVVNSGPALAEDWVPRPGGVGLSTTRARLDQMYGAEHALEIRSPADGCTAVAITLPYRV